MYTIKELYDLDHTMAKTYLEQYTYPWEALKGIKDMIIALGETLDKEEYEEVTEHVWIHKTAKVFPSAYLGAPCIIGPNTEVRHCAFIRGSALVQFLFCFFHSFSRFTNNRGSIRRIFRSLPSSSTILFGPGANKARFLRALSLLSYMS
jgi:hypothetical protein